MKIKAADIHVSDLEREVRHLKAQVREHERSSAELRQHLRADYEQAARKYTPAPPIKRAKATKHEIRLIIPDSHGAHADPVAVRVLLRDAAELKPDHVVWLGDHVDCGGIFNAHQRSYTNELAESYEDDCAAANALLDGVMAAAPNARHDYLEGNHEQHVERWIARNHVNIKDANALLAVHGPQAKLFLKSRGFRYYDSKSFHMGLSVPGSIRFGKCFFTHGVSHAKHADSTHLERFGANVVFGHIHRAISVVSRTVTSDGHGAWSCGTLAKLQPLYRHTSPTTWTHGYAIQLTNVNTGRFTHFNIPIYADGTSGLTDLLGGLRK